MENNRLLNIEISDEMKKSYIDYSMSVIVARALPDVRDGLKPVHRRILYSMIDQGMTPDKGFKKSARITGDTMAKYHPHGDASIYDAMVRMTQDFSMRYVLVEGHGNFGSIDGDSAAAQRYTEARLGKLSMFMLKDIDKETVDFKATYDEESEEPVVLPARFPNLLVNGSSGIAVGMATNIPPHNLNEVANAIFKIIDNHVEENRKTEVNELLPIISGPDFPTKASILGTRGIKSAYTTGRGKIVIRGEAAIEPMGNGKDMIIVSELPYQVNKKKFVEKIAELVKDKKIDGITDLRDESDLEKGIRVVVELRKDVNSNVILNQLYKYTQLQESYGIILLTLVNNEPKVLNVLEILEYYLEHQKDVVLRRTRFDLDKANKRAHIIEGLFIALDNIDEVIKVIRSSSDPSEARQRLCERFGLTEVQAAAIVEMRLRSLTGLEYDKLKKEFDELQILITYLTSILQDEKVLYKTIKDELQEIVEKFGDERKTKILPNFDIIDDEDLIDDELSVITLTHMDYIKRLPLSTYKSQNRGGRGILGMQTREEDEVKSLNICTTHDNILFFTSKGKVYRIKGYEIPEASRNAKGTSINNLLQLDSDEKICTVIPIGDLKEQDDNDSFVMITKNGIIKKTYVNQFLNIRNGGLIALNIRDEDELVNVELSKGDESIIVATNKGKGIRFSEDKIRNLGRKTSGVKSISLRDDDFVVGFIVCNEDDKILTVSENGYGKMTQISEINSQGRGGYGVFITKVTEKTGKLVNILKVLSDEEIMILNDKGVIIRIKTNDIRDTGRVAQGVKLINLENEDKVISISRISREQLLAEEENNESEELANDFEKEDQDSQDDFE
ncbi:MAG: DNA gyrase subunit A [Lachnospirales bacterium]